MAAIGNYQYDNPVDILKIGKMEKDIGRVSQVYNCVSQLMPAMVQTQVSEPILELIKMATNYSDTVPRIEDYVNNCNKKFGNPFAQGGGFDEYDDDFPGRYPHSRGNTRGGRFPGGHGHRDEYGFSSGLQCFNCRTSFQSMSQLDEQCRVDATNATSNKHVFVPAHIVQDSQRQQQNIADQRKTEADLEKQVQDLKGRLEKEAGKSIDLNESIQTSSGYVERKYKKLCSTDWMNGKTGNENDYKLLADILKESERVTSKQARYIKEEITNQILDMAYQEGQQKAQVDSKKKLELESAVTELLQQSAPEVNLTGFATEVKKYKSIPQYMEKYLLECVKITWNMAIQTPPMEFDFKPEKNREKNLQEYVVAGLSRSGRVSRTVIVFPILIHDKQVVCPGQGLMR